ncbi:MAG: S1 RNA-binding domain-containing protein [Myxococcota bacterium]
MTESDRRPEGELQLGHVAGVLDDEAVLVKLADGTEVHVPKGEKTEVELDVPAWVFVDAFSEARGRYLGSLKMAERLRLLGRMQEAHRNKARVRGEIVSAVQGGFAVDVEGIRAFLPSSQVALRPVSNADALIGQHLEFVVQRFNRSRVNIVLSRRPILEAQRRELMGQIRTGATVEGVVRGFADNGILFDVDGSDGFLHTADATWGKERDPRKLAKLGERFRLKVLDVDRKRARLKLGLRQTQDDPWTDADRRYPPGTKVRGMVISKTDVGCFIEFEPGLEGLIFSSGPLADDETKARLRKSDVGDELEASVLEVDLVGRRISLQLE